MLLCDGCDKGFHTYCVDPPIEVIPEGDWFCPECEEKRSKEGENGGTPASEESRKGGHRTSRRRKSRWSSGVVPKKKPSVKKKILDSDEEERDGQEKDDERDKSKMETSDLDLTPRSPQPNIPSSAPGPSSSSSSAAAAPARQSAEADPSVPTGVRIDQTKVIQWSNDLVRFTDNFPVEKLERIYTSMAKVFTMNINQRRRRWLRWKLMITMLWITMIAGDQKIPLSGGQNKLTNRVTS